MSWSRRLPLKHPRFYTAWSKAEVAAFPEHVGLFSQQRTFAEASGTSALCQGTKSLRSSPLRGSKSRDAGIRSRGQRWRGGKVNTIRSCIVGVQRIEQQGIIWQAGTLMRRVTSTPPYDKVLLTNSANQFA